MRIYLKKKLNINLKIIGKYNTVSFSLDLTYIILLYTIIYNKLYYYNYYYISPRIRIYT